jgi:hypothetical protein
VSLYDADRELPLVVESYALEGREHVVSPQFTR